MYTIWWIVILVIFGRKRHFDGNTARL